MLKIAPHILILFIIAATQMTNNLHASEFDDFAKTIIKEIGHNSSGPAATDAIRKHLKNNNIENPVDYLKEHMEMVGVIDSSDQNLSNTDKAWLQRGGASRLTFFKSRYFDRVITSYDLNVYIWDLPSGERKVSANITLNAP